MARISLSISFSAELRFRSKELRGIRYIYEVNRLKQTIAQPQTIDIHNFTDASGSYWQSASASFAGTHTFAYNSDAVYTPVSGTSVLAAVADGITMSPPSTYGRGLDSQNQMVQEQRDRLSRKSNSLIEPAEYKSRCLGAKVANAIMQALNTAADKLISVDDLRKLLQGPVLRKNFLESSALPQGAYAGASTLSVALDEKEKVRILTLADSPVFYFDKKSQEIKFIGPEEHSHIVTDSLHIDHVSTNDADTSSSVLSPFTHDRQIPKSDIGWIMIASDGILGEARGPQNLIDFLNTDLGDKVPNVNPQTLAAKALEFAYLNKSHDDISVTVLQAA